MSTAERALACGLCQAPITEAVLQGGGAKAVRGSLYCAKCAALYDQALTETLAWRTSLTGGVALTCAHCNATVPVDDVRDEAVLFTRGKLACRRCTKEQLRTILLPRTSGRAPAAGSRSSARVPAPGSGSGRSAAAGVPFARIKGDEEPPSSAIGVLLVVVALVLFLGAVGYAVTHRTKAEAGADPQLAAADKARTAADRALGLATKTHETYEKATATLKEIQELAEQYKGYLESEGKFRSAIERATRSRDGFAPALASRLMEDAAGELKKADHPEEAIAVLDRFPKELAHTMAAGELASARARYEALLTCRRAALQLLALDGVGGFADMDTLMASPDAQACGFAQTTLGQRVDAERRRRRNLAVVNATSIPVGATDLKTAAEHEFLFRLVEAEAQYSQIARANPERADAHLGLARIYLERDRLDLALPYAEQGIRLAPNRADAIQVKAWLTWLSNDKDFHDKAGRA
ncbi:MAG: tetratricopeptide repeat protein, partial [Planctomycetota bacterium]